MGTVALDSEGRQNFPGPPGQPREIHYAAIDALQVNRKDLRGLPLTRRKRTPIDPGDTLALNP
jgi:hypothetical protein